GLLSAPRIDSSYGLIVVAGLLVGLGTRYGSGCTSGHGVCGLSRLSPRSLVATLTFMGAGFATVFVVRHLI
ncbi:MAG: YeeE/YedE family protein, partial [Hylemonella sp.]